MWKIPIFQIYWDEGDSKQVQNVLKEEYSGQKDRNITVWRENKRERRIKICTVFCKWHSCLQAILFVFDIGKRYEVLVISFTSIATTNVPLFVGSTPVFAEIEGSNFRLDPADLSEKIHYGGCPCEIRELKEIAEDDNLQLIEAATEAFGAILYPNLILSLKKKQQFGGGKKKNTTP